MTRLDELLVGIRDGLPGAVGDAAGGLVLVPTTVELDLPLETQLAPNGELLATIPRGRFASGFQLPVGRIHARYTAEGGE